MPSIVFSHTNIGQSRATDWDRRYRLPVSRSDLPTYGRALPESRERLDEWWAAARETPVIADRLRDLVTQAQQHPELRGHGMMERILEKWHNNPFPRPAPRQFVPAPSSSQAPSHPMGLFASSFVVRNEDRPNKHRRNESTTGRAGVPQPWGHHDPDAWVRWWEANPSRIPLELRPAHDRDVIDSHEVEAYLVFRQMAPRRDGSDAHQPARTRWLENVLEQLGVRVERCRYSPAEGQLGRDHTVVVVKSKGAS